MEIIAALIFLLIVGLMRLYQGLVRQRRDAAAAWANLDGLLRKRLGAFMELLESFERRADTDRQMKGDLRALHHRCAFNPDPEARAQCERDLGFAIAKLAEDEGALPIGKQQQPSAVDLGSMETKIQSAADRYNQAAQKLNSKRQTFPSNIVALMFRIQTQPHFEYLSASSSTEKRQTVEATANESTPE